MDYSNLDIENFNNYLELVTETIIEYRDNLHQEPLVPGLSYPDLKSKLHEDLPYIGTSIEDVLTDFKEKVIPNSSKIGHPRFLAWMNNAGSDAGVLGEFLSIGLNQIPFMYKAGPAATVIEDLVIKWFGKLFGLSGNFGGTLVSGGTTANLTSLLVARENTGGEIMTNGFTNAGNLVLYVSEQGHATIERAVGILGIGIKNIVKIATDNEFRINTQKLEEQIDKDISNGKKPFCIVAQGGSASVGAVDPIDELARICKIYNLWLHVDAAYGGAAILSKKKNLLKGIELADSITVDPHKWFYIPTEAGMVLVKDKEKLFNTFTKTACKAYKGNLSEKNNLDYGIQLARTSRAFKIWFAFKTYGLKKIGICVDQNIELAIKLRDRIKSLENWEVLNPVSLSIICIRYIPKNITDNETISQLQGIILKEVELSGKAFLTPVSINNKSGIRICFANHRTTIEDVEILVSTLIEIADNLVLK